MPEFVEFAGLRHYPVGNAQLYKRNNNLVVSALKHPMDGIVIETGIATEVAIELAPLELNADTVLAITFQATDRARRLRGIGQWVIIPDAGGKTACLLINSKPEGISIALTGKQRQSDLFHSIIQPQRNSKWIGIATIDLAGRNTWLSGIRCRMEPLRDSKGRITQLTVIKTISSSAAIQPLMQDPIAGHLIHQGYYAIDALHIASTTQYPEGLPYEWENHISQVVMTGQHIAEVLLTHSQVL